VSPRLNRLAALVLAAVAVLGPRAALAQRIREIQIAPAYLRMKPDALTQISATAYDANGSPIDVRFHWWSSNINVATVDSLGNVRAIAPGVTVVSAVTEDGNRRRVSQATVFVLRPQTGPPGAAEPPGPPGLPGLPGPGFRPRGIPSPRELDSSIRASFDCSDPMLNSVNPMRACWDVRAVPRDSVRQHLEHPGADACPHGASPVGLMLLVSETGEVTEVRPYAASSCPEFTDRVIATARRMSFTPAQRDGKPVRAWVRLTLRGQP